MRSSSLPTLAQNSSRTSNYSKESTTLTINSLVNLDTKQTCLKSLNKQSNKSLTKLFSTKDELKQAKKYFNSFVTAPQQGKPNRSLIQFLNNIEIGFTSFRLLNKKNESLIYNSLKSLQTVETENSTGITKQAAKIRRQKQKVNNKCSLKKQLLAEIMMNKLNYSKYCDYSKKQGFSCSKEFLNKVMKMQPAPTPFRSSVRLPVTPHTKSLSLHMDYNEYEHSRISLKPFIDYQSIPCYHPSSKKVYFIGGRSITNIAYYDLSARQYSSLVPPTKIRCFGESQGTYFQENRELIFYGGINFYSVGISECNNILLRFKPEKVVEQQFDKEQSRTFHGQCAYGDYLLVAGGYSSKNKLLNTFAAYHTKKNYWSTLSLGKLPKAIAGGFAKHKILSIMHKRKRYQIYENEEIVQTLPLRMQGIYMFGGEVQCLERTSSEYISNQLYVLQIGNPNLNLVSPQIKGLTPQPRKNFAMCHTSHFLIIHGGSHETVLNQIKVLELYHLQWIGVEGDLPTRRHSHILIADQHSFLILGGKNQEGLCKEILRFSYTQS